MPKSRCTTTRPNLAPAHASASARSALAPALATARPPGTPSNPWPPPPRNSASTSFITSVTALPAPTPSRDLLISSASKRPSSTWGPPGRLASASPGFLRGYVYCVSCGTQLPDEANFCWKCGKPQKQGVQTEKPKWETCEIVIQRPKEGFYTSKYQFWASAIGLQGNYNAGESPIFKAVSVHYPSSDEHKPLNAHRSLIKKLVEEGWEPTGNRGSAWFNEKFRRQIK
ncbi:MAG TPA: hypothetical protein DEP84_05135 [Chloroflexi bacterium]|nr:hypothetical protein [Chloroflexota bacterium]